VIIDHLKLFQNYERIPVNNLNYDDVLLARCEVKILKFYYIFSLFCTILFITTICSSELPSFFLSNV